MKPAIPFKLCAIILPAILLLTMDSIGKTISRILKPTFPPLTGEVAPPTPVRIPVGISHLDFLRFFPTERTLPLRPAERTDRRGRASRRVHASDSTAFWEFVRQVKDGQAGLVRGLYVEGLLALPVVQQPKGDPAFVSTQPETLTEFWNAASGGVTGLLAHNYLAGGLFYSLETGQEIQVVYGDGSHRHYRITAIDQYQKITPNSIYSDLVAVGADIRVTSTQVFNQYYRGDHHLILQTCLQQGSQANWGLTFWVAKPADGQ